MEFKLYVGNISWNIKDEDLLAFFSQAGEVVEAKIIIDRNTGRSKGFGFVTMANEEGFKKALALDGQEMDARPLRINEARPKEERSF
jgi:nucleolin